MCEYSTRWKRKCDKYNTGVIFIVIMRIFENDTCVKYECMKYNCNINQKSKS